MFLVVPVSSALLLTLPAFAGSVAVTAAAALLPVVYDGAGVAFVSDTVADVAVWTAVGVVVLVQARSGRRQAQALRHAEEVKSRFLRAVSHEIRTPMTVILGVSRTLGQHGDDLSSAQREELIEGLESNAGRLSRLVGDLLDVDRLLRGSAVPTLTEAYLALLVADVVENIATGGRTVHLDMEATPARVDRPRIERAVEHLVVNAVRHTPDHAHIWIRLRCRNDTARLVVEDDGQGVPDALKQRLFHPFEQGIDSAASASPGTGLGLAYVAEVVRLHHGSVRVEDRPDGGARFCVELPTTLGRGLQQGDQA